MLYGPIMLKQKKKMQMEFSGNGDETINHIICKYWKLVQKEYKNRFD